MNAKEFMARVLGFSSKWVIEKIEICEERKRMNIHLVPSGLPELVCPLCGEHNVVTRDAEKSMCRYFSLFEYHTYIESQQQWVVCPQHGTQKIKPPWEEKIDEFLALNRTI